MFWDFAEGNAVLGGRESRSIRFSVGGCSDAGCAVREDCGSEADECGSLADPEAWCGKIGAIAKI